MGTAEEAAADGVSINTKLPCAPMTRTMPSRCSEVAAVTSMVRAAGRGFGAAETLVAVTAAGDFFSACRAQEVPPSKVTATSRAEEISRLRAGRGVRP